MRALNIAVFIFILSLAVSATREAYGLQSGGPMWGVSGAEVAEVGSLEQDQTLYGYNLFVVAAANSTGAIVKVVAGAASPWIWQRSVPGPLDSSSRSFDSP